jgi:hypothetical protein
MRENVQRGVELLDKVRPGWAEEIDIGNLVLSDPCQCIIGQLTGGTINGYLAFCNKHNAENPFNFSQHYGFDINHYEFDINQDETYYELQGEWIEVIRSRRNY